MNFKFLENAFFSGIINALLERLIDGLDGNSGDGLNVYINTSGGRFVVNFDKAAAGEPALGGLWWTYFTFKGFGRFSLVVRKNENIGGN